MATRTDQSSQPRARRRLRKALVVALVLVAAAAFTLTRPWVLATFVLPAASRAVGGTVTAGRISLDGFETLAIEDLRVRANGWSGVAGEVVAADRILVHFSLLSLLRGRLDVSSVDASTLRLRLAESADAPGRFSILSLDPASAPSVSDRRQPTTRITVDDLVVENGVANDGVFEQLGEMRFRGTMVPIEDRASAFSFRLEGKPDASGRLAVGAIDGSFDTESRAIDISVAQVDLDGEQLAVAPLAVRNWTKQLGLVGRIPKARFAYAPDSAPTIELDVDGIAMDLPIAALGGGELTESWSGLAGGEQVAVAAPPRMTLRKGTLRFRDDTVALVGLEGDLGARDPRVISVPFACELSIDIPRTRMQPFDWTKREAWLEQAARTAGFSMKFTIRDFRSPEPKPGEPDMLQLPRPVTRVLADFGVTTWLLNLETSIERGPPSADGSAAEIVSKGTLRITQGSGSYREFRYRLDDIDAVISFSNDNVVIERLVGYGAEGTPVTIGGSLVGIAAGAEIDIHIDCADAPIDQRLFDAFEEGPREALALLFDGRAAEGLAAANLLPDAAALVEQRRALAELGPDTTRTADRKRLERSIDAGPFALGGRAGFKIRVYSPPGFNVPVYVTGDVKVRDAGLVFGRFPYPLRIRSGSFTVLDEAIVIGGGGLETTTPAGGTLTVSGSVQIPRDGSGGRGLRPLISISATEDALNPALLAAIPFDGTAPEGWPGRTRAPAGELLTALGLSGSLELGGFVTTKPNGSESFQIKLDFKDGRAAPDEPGRTWLAAQGLPWPPGFVLENCGAALEITPERVHFDKCRGTRGDGAVEARGFADLRGPARQVELRLDNLPIDRAFEGYLGDDAATARERFARFAPSGALDGNIVRTVSDTEAVTRGNLTPRRLEITMDGARVAAERVAGQIEVDGSAVRADSLELRLSSGGADDGILRLSGALSVRELDARLSGGRIESPVLREVLSDRSAGLVALLRSRNARGLYDAQYSATGGERLEVAMRTLSLGDEGERVGFTFEPDSTIVADDEGVRFDLRGAVSEGARGRVSLGGAFDFGDSTQLSAQFTLDAEALTPALRQVLPPPLDLSAKAIALTSTGRFLLDLDEIAVVWGASSRASPDGDEPDLYRLRGEARFDGAAFDAGVPFTEVQASLPFTLRYEPRSTQPVDFRSRLSIESGRGMERAIGTTAATIASTDNGNALAIDAAGDIAGGRFDIRSKLDFARDAYTVRARIAEAGFEALRDPTRPPPEDGGGRFTALLEIGGPMGGTPADVAARTGSIAVALRDATFASTPIALRALEITQLMPPISGALHETEATMSIRGNTAAIDQVRLSSNTIELRGSGTMDLPTFAVAMRLYARGTLPILSDLIGGLTGALFAVDVQGTLGDPKVSIAALPGITGTPTVRVPRQEAPPDGTNTATPPAPPGESDATIGGEPKVAPQPPTRR